MYRHNFTKDGKQVKSDRYYTDVRIEGRRYRLALFWIQSAKDDPVEHRRRAESDFLKVETHEGKVDFHCLRHTFATWLVQGGVDIKTAQTLLRHSTPSMTLGIYAHSQSDNLTKAIDGLPTFERQAEAKNRQA